MLGRVTSVNYCQTADYIPNQRGISERLRLRLSQVDPSMLSMETPMKFIKGSTVTIVCIEGNQIVCIQENTFPYNRYPQIDSWTIIKRWTIINKNFHDTKRQPIGPYIRLGLTISKGEPTEIPILLTTENYTARIAPLVLGSPIVPIFQAEVVEPMIECIARGTPIINGEEIACRYSS